MPTSEQKETRRRNRSAWVVEVAAWTGLLWGVWLLSLSAVGVPDLVVGGLCALLCAVCGVAARRGIGQRWRPAWSLLVPLAVLPVAIVVDSAAVLCSPWRARRRRADLQTVDVGAAGHNPRQAARRALVTTIVSASPATVVLDADEATGRILVHAMHSPGPRLQDRYAP